MGARERGWGVGARVRVKGVGVKVRVEGVRVGEEKVRVGGRGKVGVGLEREEGVREVG